MPMARFGSRVDRAGARRRAAVAIAAALSVLDVTARAASAASQEGAGLPPGFVRLRDVAPSILQDVRYAGSHNLTGRPVPGYAAPVCWLRREAAEALARVQAAFGPEGLGLVVYDCYRPQRATEAFVRWAADPGDQRAKPEFYPSVDKRTLFAQGYIARQSMHSAGLAVDLGLIERETGRPLDLGTPFDRFDPRSATASPDIVGSAHAHRMLLRSTMAHFGFENLQNEWWHYSLPAAAARAWNIEIR